MDLVFQPLLVQERADRRGAENSDGEIENVKFWTQFELLLGRFSISVRQKFKPRPTFNTVNVF